MGDALVRFTVPNAAAAASLARRELGSQAGAHLSVGRRHDAILALSEVVTNAVRHAGLTADEAITVEFGPAQHGIRVSVEQPTSAMRAVATSYDAERVGGVGLALVEKVTDRWGVDPGPPGRVWFEIDDEP
jgi:anti-sigma regulatory factor (Ser/Thr protein kinase)